MWYSVTWTLVTFGLLSSLVPAGVLIHAIPAATDNPEVGTINPLDSTHSASACRCFPSQPCWPSPNTWEALNTAVSGRLIVTKPLAQACHHPFYDFKKCWEVRQNYHDDIWRPSQPSAMMYTNWENDDDEGCVGTGGLFSPPCKQGSVSLYTVNASTVADIQETVKFAAKHNIRLVIKNTGHDLLGRSAAPNSLSLWVHFRKKMELFDDFVPEGAPQGTKGEHAVLVESGVQFGELHKFTHDHQRVVVGGTSPSVGVTGGFCLAGGNGVLSKRHGLCIDNVLQYKIVTADGELVTANAYQNQELFWGLRGGGPGAYGVVTELVMRAHPALKNIIKAEITIITLFGSTMRKIMRNFLARHIKWEQEGWSGYTFYIHKVAYVMKVNYYLPDGDLDQAKQSIEDFVQYARSFLGVIIFQNSVVSLPSYLDAVPTFLNVPAPKVGINFLIGSKMVPRTMFETTKGVDTLAETLDKMLDDANSLGGLSGLAGFVLLFTLGGEVSKADAQATSSTPSWRSSLVIPSLGLVWPDGSLAKDRQHYYMQGISKAIDRLRAIVPGVGTYMNEADYNEPDWQTNFFGPNYPRLLELKRKYDPQGLFGCHHCVGSEDWDDDLMCRRSSTA